MSFSVYILRCADATLYTGYAKDVASRVALHNGEQKGGARYTSGRRPVTLVYTEVCDTKSEAMKREYAIKQLSREGKERLIRAAKRQKIAYTKPMEQTNAYAWYARLIKPSFAPPSWLFGPVWTVLYAIIAITFGTVLYKAFTRELPLSVWLPFALNIAFNLAFTPLQFGLRNNYLASADILLILGTLIWALTVIYPRLPFITYANLPYLLWVSFATVLQLSITYLNR